MRPLSREHHDGLLLCWKIRRGIQKSVEPARVGNYVRYFYAHHLEPHFRIEEEYLFPVLGRGHSMVQQAMDEHSRIRSLVSMKEPGNGTLDLLQQQLEKHIRFEERVMFQEIQRLATPAELEAIELPHNSPGIEDSWDDRFWE